MSVGYNSDYLSTEYIVLVLIFNYLNTKKNLSQPINKLSKAAKLARKEPAKLAKAKSGSPKASPSKNHKSKIHTVREVNRMNSQKIMTTCLSLIGLILRLSGEEASL